MRLNAFLLPLNSNFLRPENFKTQNFSKVTDSHLNKYFFQNYFKNLNYRSLLSLNVAKKLVLNQLNQNPRYRAVAEDEPRRSTSVIGPVMTSPSSFAKMNGLKKDFTVSNLNSQGNKVL